jgi:hypothetical protein
MYYFTGQQSNKQANKKQSNLCLEVTILQSFYKETEFVAATWKRMTCKVFMQVDRCFDKGPGRLTARDFCVQRIRE